MSFEEFQPKMEAFFTGNTILQNLHLELEETDKNIEKIERERGDGVILESLQMRRDQLKNSIITLDEARTTLARELNPAVLSSISP